MITKNCLVCGAEFKTYPSKIKIGKGKYCSKRCSLTITAIKPGLGAAALIGKKPHNYQGWRYAGRGHKYRLLHKPDYPQADKNGYIREHRYIMEQHIGRLLLPTEEIHHKDGNGLNNDISNLELIESKSKHLKLEHANGTYKHIYSLLRAGRLSRKTTHSVVSTPRTKV